VSNKISDLASFEHQLHLTFGAKFKYLVWLIISNFIFLTNIPYPNTLKIFILRLFGAKIGKGCVIKPWVKIKLPWKLCIGDHVWLGESAWLDNISDINIGNNVCISQNALLLTGNHDYNSSSFDLISKPLQIEDGVWVCANATITGGVNVRSHSVIGVGVIITQDTTSFSIYGNKQELVIKKRTIK
jgi:putative colanic acid biosynthesis acetyltransferase WcaF